MSDVLFTHTTWSSYAWMLRFYKTYTMPFSSATQTGAATVMQSGYPAAFAGFDDFYVTSAKVRLL